MNHDRAGERRIEIENDEHGGCNRKRAQHDRHERKRITRRDQPEAQKDDEQPADENAVERIGNGAVRFLDQLPAQRDELVEARGGVVGEFAVIGIGGLQEPHLTLPAIQQFAELAARELAARMRRRFHARIVVARRMRFGRPCARDGRRRVAAQDQARRIEVGAVIAHRVVEFDDRGGVGAHVVVGGIEHGFRGCRQQPEHERRERHQHADDELHELHRLLRLVLLGQQRPNDRADAGAGEQQKEHEHRGFDFRHERMGREQDECSHYPGETAGGPMRAEAAAVRHCTGGRRRREGRLSWSPRQESNLHLALRRHSFYPLNYGERTARPAGAEAHEAHETHETH
ncbi:hypothetical protein BURKHO8Y_150132 [Burkholderia sp. 8Y]|nr:hypothetical protein BURKHO8Y_150132 [Burkholderia sp. 8Y]